VSSSASSSSSSSTTSSSSSDGRRRRKHKNKKKSKSKRDKKSKGKSKDSRKHGSRKHDKKDRKDRKHSKDGRRGAKASRSPERLFHERGRRMPPRPAAAATRIQRVVRGHIVRRWSTATLRCVRAHRKVLTADIFETVLVEVVEGEMVPDVLIEIITSMDSSVFAPHPKWLQQQIKLSEAIISEVLASMAREVVREASQELIKIYLATERLQAQQGGSGRGKRTSDDRDTDPLIVFTEEELVHVVVDAQAHQVVRELVKELAQEHLFRMFMSSTVDETAEDCIYEAAALALIEVKQARDLETFCQASLLNPKPLTPNLTS